MVAPTHRLGLLDKGSAAVSVRRDQRVGVVVQAVEHGIVDPGVLDELILTRQIRDQAEEVQPAFCGIRAFAGPVRGHRIAAAAAQ